MSQFLLYAECSETSGQALGEALGIPCGRLSAMEDLRYDYVIRYGCVSRIRYVPDRKTINKRRNILQNVDKFGALETMRNAGIRVPDCGRDPSGLQFPILGRQSNHMRGRNIKLYLQPRDIEYLGPSAHYTEYIQKRKEWRIHVCNRRLLTVWEKLPNRDNYDPIACANSGWRLLEEWGGPNFGIAIDAVMSLGLDFGGVDMLLGEDGNFYILEVNTAPGISDEPTTLSQYATELSRMMES